MKGNSGSGIISIMYLATIICCVFVSSVHTLENNDQQSKRSSVVTYADFLNRVSVNVQHASDPKRSELIENVSDQIYDLYIPLRKHLIQKHYVDEQDKDIDHDYEGDNIYNSHEMQDGDLKFQPKYQNHHDNKEPVVLYRLLESLQKSSPNKNVTSTCINDTGRLITSLLSRQSWAIQFFDATGKPGPALTKFHLNFVGNYDQCRASSAPGNVSKGENGFHGNYCPIHLDTIIPMLSIQLGACLPSTCSSTELTILVNEVFHPGMKVFGIPLKDAFAVCLTAPTEISKATIASIVILTIIGLCMILGTVIDIFIIKSWKEPPQLLGGGGDSNTISHCDNNIANGYQSIDNSTNEINRNQTPIINENDTSPLLYSANNVSNEYSVGLIYKQNKSTTQQSIIVKILQAFSVYSNGKKLLCTKQAPGSLSAIHGIRFLSMSWVVLCHVYAFCLSFTVNTDAFADMLNRWTILPIANGYSSVDSFFTLSGLLTSYLTIKEMKRKKSLKINWFKFYIHRFWRLTPPYMFAMVIVLGFSQYLGHGPLWSNVQPGDKVACETNWWTNLLYVNNLVNADITCFGHTWYLANDMQFFVLSPLMLVPFYFNKFLGLASCIVVLLVSWITTGVLSTIRHWPTTSISLHPKPGTADQGEYFFHYYIVPWCRIGPFVVGIMAGYVLALSKGRRFRMPWWIVAPGWIISIASGLAVVYGIRGDIVGDNPSSVGVAALYNAVSRSVWGAALSWVIIACSAGYGGPVNALLSWSPFVVLGRLTYMVYLIHLAIGSSFYQNLGALYYFNDPIMVVYFLGILVFANMVAFVAVLALESPMLGLEKILLKRG